MSGSSLKVFAVVPARKGSKRLVGKNKKSFMGIPLASHAVLFARDAMRKGLVSDVILSTDDQEIIDSNCDNCKFVRRHPSYATDDAILYHVVKEVIDTYGITDEDAYVLILQPTSIGRKMKTLKSMIERVQHCDIPGMVSYNQFTMKPNGEFYLVRIKELLEQETIWVSGMGVCFISGNENIDIDNIWDFRLAEAEGLGYTWVM